MSIGDVASSTEISCLTDFGSLIHILPLDVLVQIVNVYISVIDRVPLAYTCRYLSAVVQRSQNIEDMLIDAYTSIPFGGSHILEWYYRETGIKREKQHTTYAAQRGDISALEYYLNKSIISRWDIQIFKEAAKVGQLQVLDHFLRDDMECDADLKHLCLPAAAGGHINVLEWLYLKVGHLRDDSDMMCAIISNAQLPALQWVFERGIEPGWANQIWLSWIAITTHHKDPDAMKRQVDMVQWMKEKDLLSPELSLVVTVESKNIHLMDWLYSAGHRLKTEEIYKTAELGGIHVVLWLREKNIPIPKDFVMRGITILSVDALDWLMRETEQELDHRAFDWAINHMGGHDLCEKLDFLTRHGFAHDDWTLQKALEFSRIDAVHWMLSRDHVASDTKPHHNFIHTLEWFHQTKLGRRKLKFVRSTQMLDVPVLEWLLQNSRSSLSRYLIRMAVEEERIEALRWMARQNIEIPRSMKRVAASHRKPRVYEFLHRLLI
ncbi:hypothetical protein PROFUN_08756 [Planoprotostelium fungivorum]|uniref:Uncharacterized protein n=1 Tax=Planoprotostelium fungivorum TaxID=1890364 RepID=A0A2P6ND89_9EUKA|nr:hypothetical protein PROFUN_08756 [Planoprotostelium fungivorum]